MSPRQRKLVGAFVMVVFVLGYVLLITALAPPVLASANKFMELAFYVVAGLAWVLPLLPLIRWMERRGPRDTERS